MLSEVAVSGFTRRESFAGEIAKLLRLAIPMIVSRAGLATMSIADAVMVSRYSPTQFASLSLADGTLGRLLDIFVAFVIGGLVLVPRAYGAGAFAECSRIWKRTIPPSLGLGIVGLLLGFFGRHIFVFFGEGAALSSEAGQVAAILGIGHISALMAIAAAVFLEGIRRPTIVAVSVIAANVLNVALNWLLIAGHMGLPALGARGSAISTTIGRVALAVVLVGYAARSRGRHLKEAPVVIPAGPDLQHQMGITAAAVQAVMIILSASLLVFAGRMGTLPLAVLAAIWSLNAPAMLIALGVADATGIRIASADNDHSSAGGRIRRILATSLVPMAVVLAVILSIWLVFPEQIVSIFTHDLDMKQSMASLLPLASCLIVLDSLSSIVISSLRALRDIAWPTTIEIACMAALVPVAVLLAFRMGQGVRGLLLAAAASAVCRVGLLIARFFWLSRSIESIIQT